MRPFRFGVIGCLLFAGVGCSTTDGADTDNRDSDPELVNGERSTDDNDPTNDERGCPSTPTCTDRAKDGSFCLPICATECQSKHITSAMWDSPYEVSGSYGLGRHQGMAILQATYTFDERGPKNEKTAVLSSLPPDMESTMLARGEASHDHSAFALCDAPSLTIDQPLANHGRTLSRAPEHAANRISIAHHTDVRKAAPETASAADALTKCLAKISNGYCDSVCGNCSYVLPVAAIFDERKGDWSRPESLVSGGGQCKEGYYGGPNQVSVKTFTGAKLPNIYTHCAYLGCSHNDEAPSLKTAITIDEDESPMTGRFGHNSNTDAEAEFRAFNACVEGRDGKADACAACGQGSDGRQDPCGVRTNTASSIWDKTATADYAGTVITDVIPPIKDKQAGAALDPPMCVWGGFPVRGM